MQKTSDSALKVTLIKYDQFIYSWKKRRLIIFCGFPKKRKVRKRQVLNYIMAKLTVLCKDFGCLI